MKRSSVFYFYVIRLIGYSCSAYILLTSFLKPNLANIWHLNPPAASRWKLASILLDIRGKNLTTNFVKKELREEKELSEEKVCTVTKKIGVLINKTYDID